MWSFGSRHRCRAESSAARVRIGQRGFTLAELMLTMAVGGVLFAVAIPSFNSIVRNSAQVSAVNELVSTFHYARDLAVTRNARVTVCASTAGADCENVAWQNGWIVFEDLDEDQTVDVGETIERRSEDLSGLALASDEFDDFLIFRPNGQVMGATVDDDTGQFTFCDDRGADYARVVILDFSGRPRSSDTQLDGSAPSC